MSPQCIHGCSSIPPRSPGRPHPSSSSYYHHTRPPSSPVILRNRRVALALLFALYYQLPTPARPHRRRLRFIIITHSLQSTRDMITKSCGWSRRHRPTTYNNNNNYTTVHGFIYVYHNNKSTHNHHRIAHALTIFHSVPIPLNVPVGGGRVATHPLVHRWRFN